MTTLLASLALPPAGPPLVLPVDPRPSTEDTTLQSLRPAGRRVGTIEVGPGRQYDTFAAGYAAAKAMRSARAVTEGVNLAATNGHPDFRVDMLIHPKPGGYPESIHTNTPDIAIYGTDRDEVIFTGAASTLGNLWTEGGDYIEGITFWRGAIDGVSASNLPKYAHHHASAGRNSVFANCRFHTEVQLQLNETLIWTILGMDGFNGGRTVWHDCELSSAGPAGLVSTNLHGGATNTTPAVYVFSDVHAPGIDIGYTDSGAAIGDEFYVSGGVCRNLSVNSTSAVKLHRQLGVATGSVSSTGTIDADTDWPKPLGGLTAAERAYYYPFL